jgi:hypothetical protein
MLAMVSLAKSRNERGGTHKALPFLPSTSKRSISLAPEHIPSHAGRWPMSCKTWNRLRMGTSGNVAQMPKSEESVGCWRTSTLSPEKVFFQSESGAEEMEVVGLTGT